MLVNICMKFHEDVFNGFKLTERTWFCHRTANYKCPRDVTQKIHTPGLWFLHSSCHLLVLNICMKFYEYILNSFKVIERTRFCQETATSKVQRDVTQKVSKQKLWFLHSAYRLMLTNICMKFHEDTLNGFKVTEWKQFCLRNCYLQTSKGHNSKSINTRVMVLELCTSSNIG